MFLLSQYAQRTKTELESFLLRNMVKKEEEWTFTDLLYTKFITGLIRCSAVNQIKIKFIVGIHYESLVLIRWE